MKTSLTTLRRPFDFEGAVAFLVGRGVEEPTIRLGAIGAESMSFARATITRHCPGRPLRVLHVGNFVGMSLAALSDIAVSHDPGSVVVSIDPNLDHLGVTDPQQHVLALLDHFGLERNNLVICGYSLNRVANETSAGTFADKPACDGTLASLERLGQRFDVALVDGNHDRDYVRRELEVLIGLLDDEGLLILDDISNVHTKLPELFEEVLGDDRWPLELVDRDERLGVLRPIAGRRRDEERVATGEPG
ncbi:MAG TPA: class I SAM-dependent methyltransferase [Thermoleophilaceae bacterium]|nr:class I SAM-dependent methyltransferase [Thermoleophilaceae bacterium]